MMVVTICVWETHLGGNSDGDLRRCVYTKSLQRSVQEGMKHVGRGACVPYADVHVHIDFYHFRFTLFVLAGRIGLEDGLKGGREDGMVLQGRVDGRVGS